MTLASSTSGNSEQTSNSASGYAWVGVQGVVNGDVRYEVSREDPPEKKFRVAKNCIAGNMPRRAEELIKQVVEVDHTSTEIAYYWTIAVLSDRSIDDLLEPERFADLDRAYLLSEKHRADPWKAALEVVYKLVRCLLVQEQSGIPAADGLDEFLKAHDRLPQDRRDEIRRHLDLILTGGFQDRFDARFAEEVREQRMRDGREGRVWKFFEPVPERPRPKTPQESTLGYFPRAMAIGGAVMAAAGILLAFSLLTLGSAKVMVFAALLLAGGGYAVARFGPLYFPARFSPFEPKDWTLSGRKRLAFKDSIEKKVQQEFDEHAPKAPLERSRWAVESRGVRTTLANEIVDLYGEPEIAPGSIDWLITWYAEETARRWKNGRIEDEDRDLASAGFALGAIGLAIGLVTLLVQTVHIQAGVSAVAFLWLAVGAGLLAKSKVDIHLVRRRRFPADQADAARRTADELKAYKARCDLLADRPDDDEMARWLDYDKIYLKTLAMNQYGLGNRDVIAHATLTEAAPPCRRARVRFGPPRYSAYVVWLFLLTEAGVRQVVVQLDFATGIASDQERTTFRYDAIASARVLETGVRFDDGRREVILPEGGDRRRETRAAPKMILSQEFRLALTNGDSIGIAVENIDDGFLERIQIDPNALDAWMLDTSDLAGALGILEAVAADGREWIAQARMRRRRRLLQESQGSHAANAWLDDALPVSATNGLTVGGDRSRP